MVISKHITKIIIAVMVLAVCLCLAAAVFSEQLAPAAGDKGLTMEYESALFDTSEIIRIDIVIDEDDWNEMLDNATAEEYYRCDVTVNGETFYGVGIRPKGNTSLTTIAADPTTDRYSFKLEFDHYVDGQTCFGLDKLVLNNNYADATNMKEALIYDMYQYLGADASLYNYAKISVNGAYWGVYLAIEAVEDSFLLRNYGTQDGELYKPDSMNIGGFDMGDMDMGDFSPSDMPGGGFGFSQFPGEMPEGSEAPEAGPSDGSPEDGGSPSQLPDGGSFGLRGHGLRRLFTWRGRCGPQLHRRRSGQLLHHLGGRGHENKGCRPQTRRDCPEEYLRGHRSCVLYGYRQPAPLYGRSHLLRQ